MAECCVSENTVEYRLFPPAVEDCSYNEIKQYLEEQVEIYYAHLSSCLVSYIWQNEPFYLRPVVPEDGTDSIPPHLIGCTDYGDNVEDEWFIVYLLCNLTEEFPGLVARISDNDGEFLLIEAADSIPKWANPDTAENRVYLYEGTVHLIPYPRSPADVAILPTGVPTLSEAVQCIRNNPSLTMAEAKVQQDIQARLQGYPEKAESSIHHAHCYIPAALAAVLHHSPNLIAPIVQAFYYRDPVDLKSCITFHHFRPGTRVMRCVRFTRCLYAQLLQQQFTPDKRSGYKIPAKSNPKYKAYDLGVKLAHGAEILCSKCGSVEAMNDPMKSVTSDPRWNRYLATLKVKGYFRGEMEGSQLYKKLLEDAKRHFVMTLGAGNTERSSTNPGIQILQILKSVDYDIEEMRKEEKSLPPEDDDSWLEITPEELDAILEKASGKKVGKSTGRDFSQVTEGMKTFVNKVASHEGAEIPGYDDSEVQFDPNSFMQTMQKVFDFDDSDDVSSSDLSEYGSEDDMDDYSSKPNKSSSKSASPKKTVATNNDDTGHYLDMKDYMDMMDRELSRTSVGESFVKQTSHPVPPPRKKKQARMNLESSAAASNTTTPSMEHQRQTEHRTSENSDDTVNIDDLDEGFQPVDVDMNVVKNLVESYNSQAGMAGPTSNILGSMGIRLPQDTRMEEF